MGTKNLGVADSLKSNTFENCVEFINEKAVGKQIKMSFENISNTKTLEMEKRVKVDKSSQTLQARGLLTRLEAIEFLRIGATKFNELRQEGIVHPIRFGTKTNYSLADLKMQLNY